MIRTLAITVDMDLLLDVPFERLNEPDISWFWVDITEKNETIISTLSQDYNFHPLSIEDCTRFNERPKVDYYEDYNFFILNSLDQANLSTTNLNLFVGKNYVVSHQMEEITEVSQVWNRVLSDQNVWIEGQLYITYLIFDKIVDQYFPAVYQIEDNLGKIEIRAGGTVGQTIINSVFALREDLIKLRRTINSMKELMYRIINSEHLHTFLNSKKYFNDIYDHLLKLSDTVESNRELTADLRDSYISINSNQMNKIMTILTIITSIFIPLTFVVGVYGMNFDFMPELRWKYGYFLILAVMAGIGISMFLWFKFKGWFNIYK